MNYQELEERVRQLEASLREVTHDEQDLQRAFRYLKPDPAGSLYKSRRILEGLVRRLYIRFMGKEPKEPLLNSMLTDNQFKKKIPRRILAAMNNIREFGNLGTHSEQVETSDAYRVMLDLCEVLDWYIRTFDPPIPSARRTYPKAALWPILFFLASASVLLLGYQLDFGIAHIIQSAYQKLACILVADCGEVILKTDPGRVDVFIEGGRNSQTDDNGVLYIEGLTKGHHSVELRKKGYKSRRINLHIGQKGNNEGSSSEKVYKLQPLPKDLRVKTSLPDVLVIIDKNKTYKTNSQGSVVIENLGSVGDLVALKLIKPGYDNVEKTFKIRSDENFFEADMVPIFASVELHTEPGETNVTMKNKEPMQTSREGDIVLKNILCQVNHSLILEKADYESKRLSFSVPAAYRDRLYKIDTVTLQLLPLNIKTVPQGVTISIDGTQIGVTDASGQLTVPRKLEPKGQFLLLATKDKYRSKTLEFHGPVHPRILNIQLQRQTDLEIAYRDLKQLEQKLHLTKIQYIKQREACNELRTILNQTDKSSSLEFTEGAAQIETKLIACEKASESLFTKINNLYLKQQSIRENISKLESNN